MSVNSTKITVYCSPQTELLPTRTAGTEDLVATESHVNHIPKRTVYRLKISNSKDLETLSRAAKLGLTSWVGGRKVRIVGVAQEQFSEFPAAKSHDSISESFLLSSGEKVTGSLSLPAINQYASVTNGIYSAAATASEKQRLYDGCCTASTAVTSDSVPGTSTIYTDAGGSQHEHLATLQSCEISRCQSLPSHCQPSGSLTTVVDTGMSLKHGTSGSLNSSMKPWSQCESTLQSSLPRGVHYLGTVAVTSQNVTSNSASGDLSTGFHACFGQSITEASVIAAVKRFSESMTGNKLSNGEQMSGPAFTCIKDRCVQIAQKTYSHPLNPIESQNTSTVSARGLKRRYMEDGETRIESAKRMAYEVSRVSVLTNSRIHCQPLTSNMVNVVPTRPANCDKYTVYNDCSTDGTVKNCKWTAEVNNNTSQQSLSLNQVPKLRLPSGSGMLCC